MVNTQVLISKLSNRSIKQTPSIKKITFCFLMEHKVYKKNAILFFIIIALMFEQAQIQSKSAHNSIQTFTSSTKKLSGFLKQFFILYLPTISSQENKMQRIFTRYQQRSVLHITYNTMVLPPELEVFYESYEYLYLMFTTCKLFISISLSNCHCIPAAETILRQWKFPCRVALQK